MVLNEITFRTTCLVTKCLHNLSGNVVHCVSNDTHFAMASYVLFFRVAEIFSLSRIGSYGNGKIATFVAIL